MARRRQTFAVQRMDDEDLLRRDAMAADVTAARKRLAQRAARDKAETQPAPEDAMLAPETTKVTETRTEAGMDGSGASESRTEETSAPAQEDRDARRQQTFAAQQGDARGAEDILKAPAHGVATAAAELESNVEEGARNLWGLAWWIPKGKDAAVQLDRPEEQPKSVLRMAQEKLAFSDPEAFAPNLISEITQVLAPAGLAAKGMKAAGWAGNTLASRTGRWAAAEVLSEVLARDPYGDRISTFLVQQPGLENTVTRYLASNDEDAPRWEGMLKNAIEASVVIGAAEGVMSAFRVARTAHKARAEQPDPDAADAALAHEEAIESAGTERARAQEVMARGLAEAEVEGSEAAARQAEERAAEVPKETQVEEGPAPDPEDTISMEDLEEWGFDEGEAVASEATLKELAQMDANRLAAEKGDVYAGAQGGTAEEAVVLEQFLKARKAEEARMEAEWHALTGGVRAEGGVETADLATKQRLLAAGTDVAEAGAREAEEALAAAGRRMAETGIEGIEDKPLMVPTIDRAAKVTSDLGWRARMASARPHDGMLAAEVEAAGDVARAMRNLAILREPPEILARQAKDPTLDTTKRTQQQQWRAARLERLLKLSEAMDLYDRRLIDRAKQIRKAVAEGDAATREAAQADTSWWRRTEARAQGEDLDAAAEARMAAVATEQERLVKAWWRNEPVDAEARVAIGTTTHVRAAASYQAKMATAEHAFGRSERAADLHQRARTARMQHELGDVQDRTDTIHQESDALSIAPLTIREENARGYFHETADTLGVQVADGAFRAPTDFEAAAGEMAMRAEAMGQATAQHAEAAKSFTTLMRETGDDAIAMREEALPDAAHHMSVLTGLANRAKRAGGRAVAGRSDLDASLAGARAIREMGGYLRWLQGDDDGAKRLLDEAESLRSRNPDPAARHSEEIRLAETVGVRTMLAEGNAMRGATSLEDMIRPVMEATETPLRLSKGRRFMLAALQLRASGLLSGITTHGKNIIGSGTNVALRVPVRFLAGVARHGMNRQGFEAGMRQAAAQVAGTAHSMGTAANMMKYAFARQGMTTDVYRRRVEASIRGTQIEQMLGDFQRNDKFDLDRFRTEEQALHGQVASPGQIGVGIGLIHKAEDMHAGFGQVVRTGSDWLTRGVNAPLAALQAEDVFLKTAGHMGAMRRLATEQAVREGLDGPELMARVEAIEKTAWRQGNAMRPLYDRALEEAEEITYTSRLTDGLQKPLDFMNDFAGGSLRVAFPFYTVLMNIGRQSLTYIPGMAQLTRTMPPKVKEAMSVADEMMLDKRADAIGRQVLGGTVLAAGAALYMSGHITGGHPSKGQFRRAAGQMRPPYSLRIGGTWVGDYRELFPSAGVMLALAADGAELGAAAMTDDEWGGAEAFMAWSIRAIASVGDATALSTLYDWTEKVVEVAEAAERGTLGERGQKMAIRELQGIAASAIPWSAFTRRLADMADGGQQRRLHAQGVDTNGEAFGFFRQLGEGIANEARRRMLWTSDELPVVRDWRGEPLVRSWPQNGETGVGPGIAAFLNPLAMMPANSRDPAVRAMLDNEVAPDYLDRKFHVSSAGLAVATPLRNEEYDWLGQRRGKLIDQGLKRLVGSEWFKALGPGIDQANALQAVFGSAERQAEAELRARFPNVDVRLHAELMREMDRVRAEAAARQQEAA